MRIGNSLYFDHNATTPTDVGFGANAPFFGESFGNPHSVDHEFGWAAVRAVEDATARNARLIRVDPDELVFTSGATEANNLALLGAAGSAPDRKRNRILLGSTDHKSSLAVGRVLQERGFAVKRLRACADGQFDLECMSEEVNGDVLLVSISLVNSEIGTIQSLEPVSSMVRARGALLHCDAAQAPCAMDVSMVSEWADLISLSAHKMYGPKGIGALYIRRDIQNVVEPIIHGGGQQRNLRSGTLPTPLCVGFGAAAELLNGPDAVTERQRTQKLHETYSYVG